MTNQSENNITGTVADIERASTHDGPGIRTVVFLKGCPLNCRWCHNPECINPQTETLFYPGKCIHCGHCAEGCYSGARIQCGQIYKVGEVMEQVSADRGYYGSEGGLTISGGEPLMQPEFTLALSKAAKRGGINTALETSLFLYDYEVLSSFDLIMFDLKLPDDARHERFCGVPVEGIKKNIKKCAELGIPMLARTPIIPTVNADSETISRIADFLYGIPAVKKYELLPYHPLGVPKQKALGLPETRFPIPSKELMEELNRYAFVK